MSRMGRRGAERPVIVAAVALAGTLAFAGIAAAQEIDDTVSGVTASLPTPLPPLPTSPSPLPEATQLLPTPTPKASAPLPGDVQGPINAVTGATGGGTGGSPGSGGETTPGTPAPQPTASVTASPSAGGAPQGATAARRGSNSTAARPESASEAFSVVKMNDADGDGNFSAEEVSSVRGAGVTFRLTLRNGLPEDIHVLEVVDEYRVTSVTVCTELAGATVPSGGSLSCEFTLDGYSPAPFSSIANTVRVRGRIVDGSTVAATGMSTVTTVPEDVLGRQIARGPGGFLAVTGTSAGRLAWLTLLAGVLAVAGTGLIALARGLKESGGRRRRAEGLRPAGGRT